VIDHDDRLERRQPLADPPHLSEVLALGDDGDRTAVLHPGVQRVLAERGKEGFHHRSGLQDPHEADVQLRHALEEEAHAVQILDSEAAKEPCPAVRQEFQLAVGELPEVAVVVLVNQRDLAGARAVRVPIHAHLGQVDRRVVFVVQLLLGQVPRDLPAQLLVIGSAHRNVSPSVWMWVI
jgi:hypothetical protein